MATSNAGERAANCSANDRTDAALDDLDTNSLAERSQRTKSRTQQDEKNKNELTHANLLKTQVNRHFY